MKIALILVFLGYSSMSFASEIYLVDPMICKGQITKKPRDMDSSYSQILMKLTSAISMRRDGSEANTLIVENDYFKAGETIDENTANFGEVWHLGPLYKIGATVGRNSLSGRNDRLELKIEKDTGDGNQTLTGLYSPTGTVVGSYSYKMNCKAIVVDRPSTIIDRR